MKDIRTIKRSATRIPKILFGTGLAWSNSRKTNTESSCVVIVIVVIRQGLVLPVMFFPFFYSPGYLRVPSADRRETLPHDRNMGVLYNASPKIRGALPPKILGAKNMQNSARFQTFSFRSRISPERVKISKIGKRTFSRAIPPRSTKKVR